MRFFCPPVILAESSVAGRKEGEGPLGGRFDIVEQDAYFGEKTWESGESAMLRRCLKHLLRKAELDAGQLDCILSGDLQNQCAGAAYAVRGVPAPYLGLYGACSTMAEAVGLFRQDGFGLLLRKEPHRLFCEEVYSHQVLFHRG